MFSKIPVTENLINRRQHSPTLLGDGGKISGPSWSARRRRLQTISAAKMLHGATPDDMAPAYSGLIAVLNESAPVEMLSDAIGKCTKLNEKVISEIVRQKIQVFEKSHKNFVRSVNIL